LGLREVPTIVLGLSGARQQAYAIADNRLAENSVWDDPVLAEHLKILSELDFDLSLTGFDTVDIDRLIEGIEGFGNPRADAVPPVEEQASPVSRLGDLFVLGPHRLFCGDALAPESFKTLLAGETAQLVFTDPPYNVPIDGHVCGLGRVQHSEFVMASGEMSVAEFTAFLTRALGNLHAAMTDGGIAFVCMDWRHQLELLTATRDARLEHKNLCVWVKDNGGMGSFYRSQHELIFVLKKGGAPHINNFGLGASGRYRTNVWCYPGINTLRRGRLEELALHPTVKPVALVTDAIKDCSHRGGIVLDPFGGSGTTLIAAERTGRRARLMELDPRYVDVIVRRWEAFTRGKARHVESGLSFAELARRREGQRTSEPANSSVRQEGQDEHRA